MNDSTQTILEELGLNDFDINSISSEDMQFHESAIKGILEEYNPDMDLSKTSALYQLLVRPYSILACANTKTIQNLRQLMDISASNIFTTSTDTAVPHIVKQFIKTMGIALRDGEYTTGYLILVFSSKNVTTIQSTDQFVHDSSNKDAFLPVSTYTLVSPVDFSDSSSELIYNNLPGSDNRYYVLLPVRSVAMKPIQVFTGDTFVSQRTIPNLVSAYASYNFTEGKSKETLKEVLNDLPAYLSHGALTTPEAMRYFITKNTPIVKDLQLIGFGDPELVRDKHNLLGVGTPGCSDIYVRTASYPSTRSIVSTGTMRISVDDIPYDADESGFTFLVNLDSFDTYGLYYPVKSLPFETEKDYSSVGASLGFTPANECTVYSRGTHIPEIRGVSPMIGKNYDVAFTAYQGPCKAATAVTKTQLENMFPEEPDRFLKWHEFWTLQNSIALGQLTGDSLDRAQTRQTQISTYFGGTMESYYELSHDFITWVTYMPNIYSLQYSINNSKFRLLGGDFMIRAPFICAVSINLSIDWDYSKSLPDTDVIKENISHTINEMPLSAKTLSIADIVHAVREVIGTDGYIKMPVMLSGNIYLPNDAIVTLNTTEDRLMIDPMSLYGVSDRTTMFCIDSDNISINFNRMGE
jgi:hypothetical protein